ncbi:DUF742 domain-containing protein [Xylanimonas ulmi]|uniref:Uncharacterized protein DUF742 n=1 Tax=Xylanimonas ulmi TaxID=228973 RepID=A0A4Q7M131_9MICO|nr:DUF742 domain-containing protein [Xylanibacterium ulmi]RZS61516.1 uncharacterized protein DUF742 [Xylanibacterium ulmi]
MTAGPEELPDVSDIRPYIRTGGRVADERVALDALVAAAHRCDSPIRERQAAEVLGALGSGYLTVAELAVALAVPLGTAQVIAADLAHAGVLRLVEGAESPGSSGDERIQMLTLLGSVIDGIGKL